MTRSHPQVKTLTATSKLNRMAHQYSVLNVWGTAVHLRVAHCHKLTAGSVRDRSEPCSLTLHCSSQRSTAFWSWRYLNKSFRYDIPSVSEWSTYTSQSAVLCMSVFTADKETYSPWCPSCHITHKKTVFSNQYIGNWAFKEQSQKSIRVQIPNTSIPWKRFYRLDKILS